MNQERVWREFAELPPEAQRQVIDFIAFLRERYGGTGSVRKFPSADLAKETFIGIWTDREDMQDSSAWVREAREREW
jgi:hypothetical protein